MNAPPTGPARLVRAGAGFAGGAKVYRGKASGPQTDRRELIKMLKALAPGDVVTVTRIDRLVRSTEALRPDAFLRIVIELAQSQAIAAADACRAARQSCTFG